MEKSFYGKKLEDEKGLELPAGIALPGVYTSEQKEEEMVSQRIIGANEIKQAAELLREYKSGKANLETRIVEDEQWWKLRHWDTLKRKGKVTPNAAPEPSSAWLFNSIVNKHADAMDNYPEPIVLPREKSDEESAKTLSSVLPVLMEYNDFEQVYSDNWWEKLKHGTAAYGVFWNSDKENGLGDIDIKSIDLLKLFWEPGVTDIQKSRNLFIVDLVDNDLLEQTYPEMKGKTKGSAVEITQYAFDDTVDTSDKSAVIDWYYKVKAPSGATVLHYVKFCGDVLLYASENDPNFRDRGWYDHGLYPVVLDCMFPEKGTPIGFGYVAICKDPQLYIDKLFGYVLENAMMSTKKRFMVSKATNINKKQFTNWNEPIIDVEGDLSDMRVKELTVNKMDGNVLNVLQMKIEEMKDTASNRDVNSGGSTGVTAASAIAALQEAGNKSSRDMIQASYRAYTQIASLCVELIRQFYDEARSFRITGATPGQYSFESIDNTALIDQQMIMPTGEILYRKPIFDLKISAQKKNPFSRMEQNERAKELYALGFFNPERASETLPALEMMDFEGIDKVKEQVQQGATLLNIVQQQQEQIAQMQAILMGITGQVPENRGSNSPSNERKSPAGINTQRNANATNEFASGVMQANTPMTSYGQRLAKRSTPSVNATPEGTVPGNR